jgi:Na+/proline symporter/signal transduction histidine kinase/CheY-like chemotaxis protein
LQSWVVFAVSISYIGALFAIAWHGDRQRPAAGIDGTRTRWLYSLTLAVYCTSWTFFGSVGRAASTGLDFLAIYVGPILVFGFGWPMVAKMVRIAKDQNSVSISDFLAVRYGKSQSVAALVTIVAVLGVIPYVALQLKAVSSSYQVLTTPLVAPTGALAASASHAGDQTALFVATMMAVFAILFGVRDIQASEHHRGLMRAVAFESVIKLTAFLTVGVAVALSLMGTPGELLERLRSAPEFAPLLESGLDHPGWWSMCVVAGLAILCLPRQFHVAVVENVNEADVRSAAKLFPGYLVLINVFVLPVAVAGVVTFHGDVSAADTFVVSVPLHAGARSLALLAFVGGLSAATSMVIVETVALSTMVCNDVIVPLMLSLKPDIGGTPQSRVSFLLRVRRVAVVLILTLAYAYYRLVGGSYPLASIGLISFTAVAQFGPTLLGGLFWRHGNRAGALAGISAGFAVWVYTLVVPSFIDAGWIPVEVANRGPWGVAWLGSQDFFGLGQLDPLSRCTLVSLGVNIACYVVFSLIWPVRQIDRQQAALFVETEAPAYRPAKFVGGAITLADLRALADAYLGAERADKAFRGYLVERAERRGVGDAAGDRRADLDDIRFTERLLAGSIGAASARVVVAGSLQRKKLSRSAAMAMLDEASQAIRFNYGLLTATLENVRQGICVFDKDMRLAAWNQRFLELNELPTDLVRVGASLDEIVRFHAVRRGDVRDSDIQGLLSRTAAFGSLLGTEVYQRPDGTIIEIAANRMPDGGFVATFTDVTERHLAARAAQEANEGLEIKVAERTTALEAAKAEAESANLGKTRFLAAVSHDLVQPLHAARLFAAALGEKYHDSLVLKMDASLRSLETLLGALLDVSKLDGGAVRAKPTTFRLDELLWGLSEEFTAIAAERGLGFTTVRSGLGVRSDPILLRRILQNFLSNAMRYTPEGRVLLGCRRRGDKVLIEVWDTGIGIPEEKIGEIFEEFHQLQPPEEAGEKGLGLGLAIVDRIARMLDHPIRVRSRPGAGSCFAVEIPLVQVTRETPASVSSRRPRGLGGALVVCIDNDRPILDGTGALLGGWNCRVVAAATGGEALRLLAGERPRALIVDFHLEGGETGLEAAQEVQMQFAETIPVIVVTADHSDAVKDAVDALGYALTHKPVRPAALRALLGSAIALSRVA